MAKPNPANERVKHDYFKLLKEARGYDESSVDTVAASIRRFENYTRGKAFNQFHIEQAIGFKNHLAEERSVRTGHHLSKSTQASILRCLREFFLWLSGEPGYRSRISYGDTRYFRLSEKDERAASTRSESPTPTLEQIMSVLQQMPAETVLQRRDRTVIAITILTGARDNAVASLKLKHVDLARRHVFQDPRAVRTKASKAIRTWFFPVGGTAEEIVSAWVRELREDMKCGDDHPLFPRTLVQQGSGREFVAVGLSGIGWANADPIRKIFRTAFESAGLPYFNPHSFRKTLAQVGERLCKTPEEFKAWSQNLGHEQVLTTFSSYGAVPDHRQAEIILNLGRDIDREEPDLAQLLERAARRLKCRRA